MNKIKINNWFLYYNTEKLDSAVVNALKNLHSLHAFKENKKRKIFKIPNENGTKNLYLKWHLINGIKDKVCVLFKNKAMQEFESCLLLQKYGLNVANYFAWGMSTEGETIIVSEEAENTQTARSYWFDLTNDEFNRPFFFFYDIPLEICKEADEFIEKFKQLIKCFIVKKIYHPDFHFGNLLWDFEAHELLIIDPYGIKKKMRLSAKQKFDFIGVIVGLRNYLSREDLVQFCLDIELFNNAKIAHKEIENYLNQQFSGNKDWGKRFKQILAGREKYNLKLTLEAKNNNWDAFIRCGFNEKTLEKQQNLSNEYLLNKKYEIQEYSDIAVAKNIWLNSFIEEYQFKYQVKKPIIMKIFNNKAKIYFTKN